MSNHHHQEAGDGFGSDSFLDIVANIVGILIILVMVVGVRVQHFSVQAAAKDDNADALSQARTSVDLLEADLAKLKNGVAAADAAWATRLGDIEAGQADLAALRSRIASDSDRLHSQKTESDLQKKQLLDRQRLLDALKDEARRTGDVKPKTVKVESFPTPISQTVDGTEAHFQLLGGRIAYVPFRELVDKSMKDARGKIRQLRNSPKVTAVVPSACKE